MSSSAEINSSFGGKSLNLGQRLAVSKSLAKLQLQQGLSGVVFWGKVTGSEKDYLIAKSVDTGKLAFKKAFYVSVDEGVTFSELRPIDEVAAKKASALNTLFTGNLQNRYGPEPEDAGDDENKAPDTRLSEEQRLYYVVSSIENDTAIVPVGAYCLTANSRIVRNKAFAGPTSSSISNLASYAYFRAPQDQKTLTKLKCRGLTNSTDFLDGIANAKPNGVWAIQTDSSGTNATVRNLEWLGYEFQASVGSASFAGAYFGDGTKNQDVALMV